MIASTLSGTPLRERLTDVLNSLLYGLWPPDDCTACRDMLEDRCGPCSAAMGNVAVVNAAIGEVQDAPDDDTAMAVSVGCFCDLGGITPRQAIHALVAVQMERHPLADVTAGGGAR